MDYNELIKDEIWSVLNNAQKKAWNCYDVLCLLDGAIGRKDIAIKSAYLSKEGINFRRLRDNFSSLNNALSDSLYRQFLEHKKEMKELNDNLIKHTGEDREILAPYQSHLKKELLEKYKDGGRYLTKEKYIFELSKSLFLLAELEGKVFYYDETKVEKLLKEELTFTVNADGTSDAHKKIGTMLEKRKEHLELLNKMFNILKENLKEVKKGILFCWEKKDTIDFVPLLSPEQEYMTRLEKDLFSIKEGIKSVNYNLEMLIEVNDEKE